MALVVLRIADTREYSVLDFPQVQRAVEEQLGQKEGSDD
jgi:hypothetical protein